MLEELSRTGAWAVANPAAVAEQLAPHIASGAIRGLGVTSPTEWRSLPGIRPVLFIAIVLRLIEAFRTARLPIIHTRECHKPDLSDCPPAKRLRGKPSMRIGDPGAMGRILIAGEPGADIVPDDVTRATVDGTPVGVENNLLVTGDIPLGATVEVIGSAGPQRVPLTAAPTTC